MNNDSIYQQPYAIARKKIRRRRLGTALRVAGAAGLTGLALTKPGQALLAGGLRRLSKGVLKGNTGVRRVVRRGLAKGLKGLVRGRRVLKRGIGVSRGYASRGARAGSAAFASRFPKAHSQVSNYWGRGKRAAAGALFKAGSRLNG